MKKSPEEIFWPQGVVGLAGEAGISLRKNMWPTSLSFWMAIGYLALVIIRPWEVLFPWMAAIHFERLYVILMLIVVACAQNKQPVMSFQSAMVMAFSAALMISILTAYNSTMAWEVFYVYLALVIFYFVLLKVIHSPYTLIFSISSYIFIMALYLAKSQWEYWLHGMNRYNMGVVRMVGIESSYGGPNALAMSIVVSLPFALFLWRHRKEFVALWPDKWGKRYFLMLKVYGALALSSLVMTNSRSGVVSFIFFLLLLFVGKKGLLKKIGYVLASLVFLGLIWQMLPADNQGRLRTIWAPETGPANAQVSAEGRVKGLEVGLEMFERHPGAGVGLGNFVEYRINKIDGVPLQAHNLAGQLLGELGLLGTIPFLLMVFATFSSSRKIKKRARELGVDGELWPDFATACRDSVLLLFFTGIFGHNMLRYNWLWAAAFAMKGAYFLKNSTGKEGTEVSNADG